MITLREKRLSGYTKKTADAFRRGFFHFSPETFFDFRDFL